MRRVLACLFACILCAPSDTATADEPSISAHVRVLKPFEPGAIETYVRIPFHRDNRAYTVALYCRGVLDRHSTVQLDQFSEGRPEPPVIDKTLAACDYLVVAMVHGAGGKVVARTPAMPVKILCFPCRSED